MTSRDNGAAHCIFFRRGRIRLLLQRVVLTMATSQLHTLAMCLLIPQLLVVIVQ